MRYVITEFRKHLRKLRFRPRALTESKLLEKLNQLKEDLEVMSPIFLEEANYQLPTVRAVELDKEVNMILHRYHARFYGFMNQGKYAQFVGLPRYFGFAKHANTEWIIAPELEALSTKYELNDSIVNQICLKEGEEIIVKCNRSLLSVLLFYPRAQELIPDILNSRKHRLEEY